MIEYWIGVDGGGTGTRAVVALPDGRQLGFGHAGPSALGQGVNQAWTHILQACTDAFSAIGSVPPPWTVCAMGAGLSGVSHRPWSAQFHADNPGFARLVLDTDAHTMLLGAHGGNPGAMVAAGTGSVGEALHPGGRRFQVSGWGFPVGDEGSGAWLGLRAMSLAQQALDQRGALGPLAQQILERCGASREDLQAWCAVSRQFEYAQLARLVFGTAASDPAAENLLNEAACALDAIARALDPAQVLPLAICGSVGVQLKHRLASTTLARCVEARNDATVGALYLIRAALKARP